MVESNLYSTVAASKIYRKGAIMKIRSAEVVRREEEMIKKAVEAGAKKPRTTDDTDYKHSQKQLHDKGLEIRAYINTKYPVYCEQHPALKTFRASYGYSSEPESQEIQLTMNLAKAENDMELILMLLTISEINTEMLYEAEKLCIVNPRPWWDAWADELGPYDKRNDTTPSSEPAPEAAE